MRTYIFNSTGNKVEGEGTPDCDYMSIFEDDVISNVLFRIFKQTDICLQSL